LRIRNNGRSVAKSCEGKLVSIKDAQTSESRTDFDPVTLHWVGSTRSNPLDIYKSESEYLDLIFVNITDLHRIFIYAVVGEQRGINLAPPRQNYILTVILYGDNVEPLEKSFYLKTGEAYDNLELTEYKP